MLLKIIKNTSRLVSTKAATASVIDQALMQKLAALKLNNKHFDLATLQRLSLCSNQFLIDLVRNLETHGLKDKQLANALKTYENWSGLTHETLKERFQMFRELALTSNVYMEIFARNSHMLTIEKRTLQQRFKDFKMFFTNNQLERLLVRSPNLLTDNFDNFSYK